MDNSLPSDPLQVGVARLHDLLGIPNNEVGLSANGTVTVAGRRIAVIWRSKGSVAQVAAGIRLLRDRDTADLSVLMVPFMGEKGHAICEEAGVCWLDLSGNAQIIAPGLRVVIKGNPNKYKAPGRPSTAFAPKSSRLARWLLMHEPRPFTQRELARATDVDEGFTSRVIGKLLDEQLLSRNTDGLIEVPSKDLLLEAWAEEYRFDKHRLRKGHIPGRSGEEITSQLAASLATAGVDHAFTGLAAAWRLNGFAAHRLTTVYLAGDVGLDVLAQVGFRDDARGANTWLVLPNDEGVFHGAEVIRDIRCVHPVQAWLDLATQPERAVEAAEAIRPSLFEESAR